MGRQGEGVSDKFQKKGQYLIVYQVVRIVHDTILPTPFFADSSLAGVPPEAWTYKLGNRSALEWILDQYKEKKPKDPTSREKFNSYRFADHKHTVIDLLARVTRVKVETQRIVEAMRAAPR